MAGNAADVMAVLLTVQPLAVPLAPKRSAVAAETGIGEWAAGVELHDAAVEREGASPYR